MNEVQHHRLASDVRAGSMNSRPSSCAAMLSTWPSASSSGVAFTAVVNSLVKDIFTPIIGLIVGGIDFNNIFVTLKGPSEATLADAQKAGAVTLNFGVFLNAVIQFLIVSFAVFWLIKVLTRMHIRQEPATAAPPPPPRSELLLEEIRDLLTARQI